MADITNENLRFALRRLLPALLIFALTGAMVAFAAGVGQKHVAPQTIGILQLALFFWSPLLVCTLLGLGIGVLLGRIRTGGQIGFLMTPVGFFVLVLVHWA
jgi:hypothetical protein